MRRRTTLILLIVTTAALLLSHGPAAALDASSCGGSWSAPGASCTFPYREGTIDDLYVTGAVCCLVGNMHVEIVRRYPILEGPGGVPFAYEERVLLECEVVMSPLSATQSNCPKRSFGFGRIPDEEPLICRVRGSFLNLAGLFTGSGTYRCSAGTIID